MFRSLKLFTWIVFILYLTVLIYIIVLKGGSALSMARHRTEISFMQKISNINYIPFKTIFYYLGGNQAFIISKENILGNIITFAPLGFLLPILYNKFKKLKNIFFISVGVSLSIEIVQLLFNLGSCDIDDLILNVLGSILGFEVFKILSYTKKRFRSYLRFLFIGV